MMLRCMASLCYDSIAGVAVAASVLTILTLSVDRYFAIKRATFYSRWSLNRRAVFILPLIWIVSFLAMTPNYSKRWLDTQQLISDEAPVHFCVEVWKSATAKRIYESVIVALLFAFPGLVIGACYLSIGRLLLSKEGSSSSGVGKVQFQQRERVAKLSFAFAAAFALCWTPYYCVTLFLVHSEKTKDVWFNVMRVTSFLGLSNSAINPFLYFFVSKPFWSRLRRLVSSLSPTGRTGRNRRHEKVCMFVAAILRFLSTMFINSNSY